MATIRCYCTECRHNEDGECSLDTIYIDEPMTAAGMIPVCMEYEEEDDDD